MMKPRSLSAAVVERFDFPVSTKRNQRGQRLSATARL
jgi:hypothetical protein